MSTVLEEWEAYANARRYAPMPMPSREGAASITERNSALPGFDPVDERRARLDSFLCCAWYGQMSVLGLSGRAQKRRR